MTACSCPAHPLRSSAPWEGIADAGAHLPVALGAGIGQSVPMTSPADRLASLSLGFRSRYLTYDELTRQVHAWAEAFPEIVELRSLGTSHEGRALWHLTIGRDPKRVRPAAWVDGNMHASELTGSSV